MKSHAPVASPAGHFVGRFEVSLLFGMLAPELVRSMELGDNLQVDLMHPSDVLQHCGGKGGT